MLQVTIGTREINCEFAEHKTLLIRGVQRPAIELTFPDGAIALDALRNLVSDESKTQTILLMNPDETKEDGTHPRETLEGYTIRSNESIQLRTVEVEPATYEHPATYADKVILQLGLKFAWEN